MFTEFNRAFVAEQVASPQHALAARAADQLLDDLGMAYPSLPAVFRLDAASHAELGRATRVLADAQDTLLAHLCTTRADDELAAMFEVPPGMAKHIDWRAMAVPGMRMLRADIVPTPDGYRFCEVNHFSGVGGGEGFHSAHTYTEAIGMPTAGNSPFRELAFQYVTKCRADGLTRVVVLDTTKHRELGYGEQLMLRRYLRLMAPDLEIAYHDELTYPARWLRPDETRRTLVHRIVTYDDTTDDGAFLAEIRDSGATMTCMFEAEVKMHRRWFAMFCDPEYRHLLTPEQRATIDEYVPHTAVVPKAGLEDALADKDRLVFKRSNSYGGKGIAIGDDYETGELRELLTRDEVTWVVQRRVHSELLDLPTAHGGMAPYEFVLGLFLFGDRTSGLLVRGTTGSAVVNLVRGGGMSWVFE